MILAVVLLYLYPASEALERQDDLAYLMVYKSVTSFVDAVRDKGYVSPVMYNDFFNQLAATGNTFDIQLEHDQKRYTPVYTDPADASTFQNRITTDYDGYYTPQIMGVLFPDKTDPIDSPSRVYKMEVGDFFNVTVKNTNTTGATVLRNFLTNGDQETKIAVTYGGMIRNEDH